ncbi:MAG: methionine adenosyltransferase [SAR202 cluster bacterium]|nr:methionine adenosyltransferase [SAR202 cluster bacterium]|tara:strand:+ start:3532 stop:4713 length:1182 start_codon:yes stop_codon:yes gene_type:complete
MNNNNYLLTSESVSGGHPDKMCDQISDSILDAYLEQDPLSRVACETSITTGLVLVFGEITSKAKVDIKNIVKETIKNIGYDNPSYGFDSESCSILIALDEQSSDISAGVTDSLETRETDSQEVGAGDQGMMIGYATNETKPLMPLPIFLAHELTKEMTNAMKNKTIKYLRPDSKSQVTVEYNSDHVPQRVDTIVISTQHDPDVNNETIHQDIKNKIIKKIIPDNLIDDNTKYFINPSGRFVIGGPVGDAGLTGRKIIVDTYGGSARHGGGAFSGKDPTKVDRSAAYAARWVAKNIVGSKLADKAEVQLSYAIGVSRPISIQIDTKGTSKISEGKLVDIVNEVFDLRPQSIIDHFNLRRPIYKQTAAYGHFGRDDLELPWEKLDKVEPLSKALE